MSRTSFKSSMRKPEGYPEKYSAFFETHNKKILQGKPRVFVSFFYFSSSCLRGMSACSLATSSSER